MSQKSDLEIVKANVRSLIQSQPDSCYTIMQLQKDYQSMMGHKIPLLGHRDIEHFLRHMPDVVKISGYGQLARLEYIPTSKSKHIGEMVKYQKQNTGKRRNGRKQIKRAPRNENMLKFPQYSDESDWDERTISASNNEQNLTESFNKLNVNTSLDNDNPNTTINSDLNSVTVAFEEEKKCKNRRAEFLSELRKKYEQRENATPSSSSTQSSETASNNSNGNKSQATTYRGIKYIREQLKKYEAAKNASAPTPSNDTPVQSKTVSQMPGSRFMQLSRRQKPNLICTEKPHQSEEDEAIPAAAVTDLIKRMDLSETTKLSQAGPTQTEIFIPGYDVIDKFKVGEILSLIITEVDNPFLFYFHLYKDVDEFEYMQNEMQNIYSTFALREHCLSEHHLYQGKTCAAYYNENWHRAVIDSVPQDPNEFSKIKLFLVDQGLHCVLTNRHIKHLVARYSHMPAQAISGKLAGIKFKPYSRESQASQHFRELVQDNHLYGCVTSVCSKTQQVALVLLDTNVTPKRRIHEELIKCGLVEKA